MLSLYLRENDLATAKLSFHSRRVSKLSHIMPKVIDITSDIEPDRVRVETFIKTVFRDAYQADIQIHYPYLISVSNEAGEILAAAGFRYAQYHALFLEQYTASPIEQELSALYGKAVQRQAIVEIGSLASHGTGAAVFLFAALASYLAFKQIQYTVITGTQDLQRHLQLLGLQPHKICDADPARLQYQRDNWGGYYATQPRVLAGSVQQGVESLQRTLGSVYEEQLPLRFHRGALS